MTAGRNVREIVVTGANALLSLWVPGDMAFKRSSNSPRSGSTSSPRATFALLDALEYSDSHGEVIAQAQRGEILSRLVTRASVLHDSHGFDEQRESDINKTNSFTDAHLAIEGRLLALVGQGAEAGRSPGPALIQIPHRTISGLERRSAAAAKQIAKEFDAVGSGFLARQSHDFVTYFGQRALDFCSGGTLSARVIDRVHRSVLLQIGHYTAGSSARFDLGALVFGIALLQRAGRYHEPEIAEGLRIVLRCQEQDGSWPMLRTISDGGRTLFISSYEVALTLANLLLQRLGDTSPADCDEVIHAVERVVHLASIERRDAYGGGWANDRNPAVDIVEGWTTAVVVSLAVRYHHVLSLAHRLRCFARYDADSLSVAPAGLWPDLYRFERLPIKRSTIPSISLRVSDPTEEGVLAVALRDRIVMPVLQDWIDRPDKDGVSLLLPGDPGTRKTTLVKEIAKAIDWPILTLSPPVFLRGGLENFEAAAASIFHDLQLLSRVVVFFDECEEFFRKRPRGDLAAANRTVGAFITAGMLPRLQALHDSANVIFVVATNALLDELDSAATRRGRFDLKVSMLHPTKPAQERYLGTVFSERAGEDADGLMSSFQRAVRAAERPEILDRVPFSQLDRIAEHILSQGEITPDALVDIVLTE